MRKILGTPLTLFIIGVLVVGVGTALLVKYLSNTVTHTVTVDSPLSVTGDTPLTLSIYGGENITYNVTTTNNANVTVNSYPITELAGPAVWDGTEFTTVTLNGVNVMPFMYVVKDDGTLTPFSNVASLSKTTIKVFLDYTSTGTLSNDTWAVGSHQEDEWLFQTPVALTPGTYTFKTCHLFDVLGDC